jgi:hypothetical protein
MINLFVSSDPHEWESKKTYFLFQHERCLNEYIMTDLQKRFASLWNNEIKQLIKLPTIFAYEEFNRKDALIGEITNITVLQQNVKIDFNMKKANGRKGGVGYESEIILSQISSNSMQTKYIPVVIESNKNRKVYLPKFLLSRKYIDLTKESGYDELITDIRTKDKQRWE